MLIFVEIMKLNSQCVKNYVTFQPFPRGTLKFEILCYASKKDFFGGC